MSMQLRPYQESAIESLKGSFAKGHKNVVLCMPTGAGKTVTFAEIARRSVEKSPDKQILILTDRIELLTQAGGALRKTGLDLGFIISGGSAILAKSQCLVGMVETYYRRVQAGRHLRNLGLIIIDEAHKGNFKKIINLHQETRIIGATATPLATSLKDPLKNYFSEIVVGTDIPELIKLGFLSTPRYFAVPIQITASTGNNGDYRTNELFNDFNKAVVYDGCVENYKLHAMGKKTLVFCVNIEHTLNTAEAFINAGHPNTRSLVSEDDSLERRRVLRWFSETPSAILVSCSMLTTGFDEPTIECVILNRATKSLPLFLQMVGRGARVTPDKNKFLVIDMGNNLHTHGRWEMYRDWRDMFFNPKKPRKNEDEIEMIKECPNCQAMVHISVRICTECGEPFPIKEKDMQFALTQEINPKDFAHLYEMPPEQMSVEELMIRAELGNEKTGRKYKKGWVVHHLKARQDAEDALREYARKMGYKPQWVQYQLDN